MRHYVFAAVVAHALAACSASSGATDAVAKGDAIYTADLRAADFAQQSDGRADGLTDTGASPDAPQPPVDSATSQCPCALDYYCDLATQHCVLGCRSNTDCAAEKFCDQTQQRCRLGCRNVAACKDDGNPCTTVVCDNGQCLHKPNSAKCADDGNNCTADVCSGGACTHAPDREGFVCAQNDCGYSTCKAGSCLLKQAEPALVACADDGNSCTSDRCDGQGTCAHTPLPNGTDCKGTWTGGFSPGQGRCFSTTCVPITHRCCPTHPSVALWNQQTGKLEEIADVIACGCDGTTLRWTTEKAGQKQQHAQSCSLCPTGATCHPCYAAP
ncbi:MAG: hypothetical protein H6707_01075 [Deltaproteobacteria bacterium]|nr:hypothetical protein [Deltaproteobacteria bacterium]